MPYYCRFCEKEFEKTKPSPEQRKEFHKNKVAYNYPGLYQHILDVHGYNKDSRIGKLKKVIK